MAWSAVRGRCGAPGGVGPLTPEVLFPPLPPGSAIGILGGGQLGRMLAMAAARLGLGCHVFSPDPASPAFDVAALRTVAEYHDEQALAAFAHSVAVVTYEFENIDVGAVERLTELVP